MKKRQWSGISDQLPVAHRDKEFAMNLQIGTDLSAARSGDFEETLRLIASLPAPEGLEERVQAGLRTAPQFRLRGRARILAWPAALRMENGWLQSSLARSAAAAAIAAVVAGGGWSVYSRVQLNQAQRGIALPRVAMPSGFSSAGAMRTPRTLNGPVVARPRDDPGSASG